MQAMKLFPVTLFLALIYCLGTSSASYAQKKILDHSVYDSWKKPAHLTLTPDGKWISYEIRPQEGDARLVIRQLSGQKEYIIDRGYQAGITPDGKYAVCMIKPPFTEIRQAKLKKTKTPQDSLVILRLSDGYLQKYPEIKSWQMGKEAKEYMAYLSVKDTALILHHFTSGKQDTIPQVKSYAFNKQGNRLTAIVQPDNKKKTSPTQVILINLPDPSPQTLASGSSFYTLPAFDESGQQLVFLASQDTINRIKTCDLYYTDTRTPARLLLSSDGSRQLPQGWSLNEYSSPLFSHDGQHIYLGVAPILPPKDTTLITFETAELDLWHYATPEIPPTELKNRDKDLKKTYSCVLHLDQPSKLIRLTGKKYENIALINEGNAPYVLASDRGNYLLEQQWTGARLNDAGLIDTRTGKYTPVTKALRADVMSSPGGNYLFWYDRKIREWFCYNIKSQQTICLTENMHVHFWNEENDMPDDPAPYGYAGWLERDQALLLYDAYDIWKFDPEGITPPECLTKGKGRAECQTYRYLKTDPEQRFLPQKEKVLLAIFDHHTKKNGYASWYPGKANTPKINILEGYSFPSLVKASKASTYLYTKANFNTSLDVYATTDDWKTEERLSDINPQMKEYNWGTAELVTWTSLEGEKREGILYKPEDFDPTKKYPMLLYFYEKKSDGLYNYIAPAPSRSAINYAFYCSRGYLVFVPDIRYIAGIPGECAYNSIIPGVESLCQNPWVDRDNIGIQGQSWGGYQVAYLITRTHMFKAANAGAPVANMTSAYGGIRWESGKSRQFQYEHTQSRIGHNLWESPELYLANSPLFKADRINTPLLIMHNDNDGAVPWYQGIELFMALRRLGRPVWMLQYNHEEHNLSQRRNQKDLAIRQQQFFDHFLKGAPQPAWMKYGIPAIRKGEYSGLELIRD